MPRRFFPLSFAVLLVAGLLLISVALVHRPSSPLAMLDRTSRALVDSVLTAIDAEPEGVRLLSTPAGEMIDFSVRIDGALVMSRRARLTRTWSSDWRATRIADLPTGRRSTPRFDPLAVAAALVDTSGGLRGAPQIDHVWFQSNETWVDGAVVKLPLNRYRGESLPWHGTHPDPGAPVDLELRFDASGTLREARDLLIRVGRTGSGLVFDPNPVAASGLLGLRDGDPVEEYRVTVQLDDLDESNRLRGSRVFVETSDPLYAEEESCQFWYLSTDPRFEEVMAYYHIDRTRAWVESLGYGDLFKRPQRVAVHATLLDNSWYSPITGKIHMGDGGVDDAEDADIIIHEFGHAIHDAFVPGFGDGDTRAISEGFADYLAATISGDPCVGDWDATTYSPPCLRRTDEHLHYPEDLQGNPHADGRIWSGALWEIRSILGRQTADLVVLEGLLRQSPNSGFREAAEELMAAAEALGLHDDLETIRAVFANRGLMERRGALRLTGNETAVVPLDKRWPGQPSATQLSFNADGSVAVGDSLTVLPLRVAAAKLTDITYAATHEGFGWEWRIDIDDRSASGSAFLSLDGSLDFAWLGDPDRWPEGETGIIENSDIPAILSAEESFGQESVPSSFVVEVGANGEILSGGRIALRRDPPDWDIEMWLPPPPDERARVVALKNPSRGRTKIRLDLPSPGMASLDIYDAGGRRVRSLLSEENLAAGPHQIVWDGRNETGGATPAGIYWVRLRFGSKQQTVSIVRLKD